jgi:two-component system nitrogen regulation response regulator GlnG
MQEVFRTIARVAPLDLPVLIVGESGAGKHRVARTIHDNSKRASDPFLEVRLAGASRRALDDLFQTLAATQTGSVFIDDVDDISEDAQRRLSAWLQGDDGSARRPRVIAAARGDLKLASVDGRVLADLCYRLSVVEIRLPALRERPEDIGDLARALLVRARREGLPEKVLDASAISLLEGYRFPGNVRELDNLLRRAAVLKPGATIAAQDLAGELHAPAPPTRAETLNDDLDTIVSKWVDKELSAGDGEQGELYDRALALLERPLLERTLEVVRGNQIRAASLLGINRNTLRKKMQLLGLSAGRSS